MIGSHLLAGFLLAGMPSASAYVPPSSFVIHHAVHERLGLRNLEWTAKVTDVRTKSVFLETLRVDFGSGKVQFQFETPGGDPLGGAIGSLKAGSRLSKFWLTVALDPNEARVIEALLELGVPPGEHVEASFARSGTTVTWAWGEVSRIQFQKDEFVPLSYEVRNDTPSDALVFKSFASASAKARVPKQALVRVEGKDAFEFELKSIKTDTSFKDKLSQATLQLPLLKEWISLVR